MISKERLQELIEQGATIWTNDFEEIKLDKNTCEVCEVKTLSGEHLYWCLDFEYEWNNEKQHTQFNLDELEEDVEKGKWEQEFKRIPRTSYLDLPNYEEFIKDKIPIEINGCNGCYIELNCKHNYLRVYDYDCDYEYYKDTISKEHYIEACQILKSLFIGEY